ncbi:hypothetical protein [Allomuricauda sp. SCSIO 65647]|uniref:hypothetical protein n=1 Tax=Allomuricauda sp. SCSIO 65647 TaxID=2908843 RepID=UPI001F478FF4|nr:hypothetical protein [Muricauda sp. SCSIO 65647]UJH66875.1 hypothetical protein L0P89_13025 [Muricauda sp. SCSIO 65647]
MKKFAFTLLVVLLVSCSDGDLQIETIDFDDVAVSNCDNLTEDTQLLFKINDAEALILTLQSNVLKNGVLDGSTVTTESSIPNQSKLVYRVFSDNVSSGYFCDDIPPVTPTVTEEVEAGDGLVTIETTVNADSTAYNHTITLSEITLVNDQGERITDLTINEFGEIATPIN